MNGKIILDSSALIQALRGDDGLWAKISSFSSRATTSFALAEILAGAKLSKTPAQNLAQVRRLIATLSVFYPGGETVEFYSDIWVQLRRRGTPIPTNDIWIAALCLEHDLPLLTNDNHFSFIDGLKVVFS